MLRGNPIGLNPKTDYRVLLLDMVPSVLVLDDKKIRSTVKYKGAGGGSSSNNSATAASKSLSYCTFASALLVRVALHSCECECCPLTHPLLLLVRALS